MIPVASCFKHISRCKTRTGLLPPKCTTTIPIGIWPSIAILSKAIGSYQSFTTRPSSDLGEVPDGLSDHILSLDRSASKLSEEVYTVHIRKLCGAGKLSTAANLVQALQERNIFLPEANNILLKAAGEKNDTELSSQIFKHLLLSGKPLSSTSYLYLARAFIRTDNDTHLLRFVKEVSELAFPSSTIIVNRIISAFSECGQVDKALLIFDNIKGFKCKPDLITYNTILDMLGRIGRTSEMLELFTSMKEACIFPDIISYNTLINSLRKIGRLDLCLVYFKEMTESGFEPDLLTYTALIDSFGRSGNINESVRLFCEMKQRKIRPSIYIYRSLISNLKRAGKLELAMKLSEEMSLSSSDLARPEDFKKTKAKVFKR